MFDYLGEHDYDHDNVSIAVPRYNCIAWAAGENHRRWWPADWDTVTFYWPPHLPRQPLGKETLENFVRAFESLGYNSHFGDNFGPPKQARSSDLRGNR